MYRFRLTVLSVLVLGVVFSGLVWAEDEGDSKPSSPPDPAGSWKWDVTTPDDNTLDFSLKLAWDGKKLSGKYTAFGSTTDIEDGKLEGDALSFRVQREFNGNQFTVGFDGKVQPDDIVGTVAVDFGDGPREFDWHAKRVVEADDVLGTWQLHLEMPNREPIEPRITITKDDKGLHGAYVSPFGEREAKNVKIEKNELSWEISGENDQFTFKVVYHGQPRGNTIAGTNEFDFNGNTGTMEFTGKRLPPKEEKQPAAEPSSPAASESP